MVQRLVSVRLLQFKPVLQSDRADRPTYPSGCSRRCVGQPCRLVLRCVAPPHLSGDSRQRPRISFGSGLRITLCSFTHLPFVGCRGEPLCATKIENPQNQLGLKGEISTTAACSTSRTWRTCPKAGSGMDSGTASSGRRNRSPRSFNSSALVRESERRCRQPLCEPPLCFPCRWDVPCW